MALTLVEASKYSNDILQKGVIELLYRDDPLMKKLPFKDIKGNGLTYNVETTLSGAQFYQVGDTWVETTGTVTPATANTAILGGDADVDNFLEQTRGNLQDLMAEAIAAKTKAIKRAFLDELIYGYLTGGITQGFDGIAYLIRNSTAGQDNTVAVATVQGTGTLLSLERLEKAVDLVRGDKPDLILMSKAMRRGINKYLNGVGGITKRDIEGGTVQQLFGVDIAETDYIRDNESADLQYGTNEAGAAVYGYNYADTPGLDSDLSTTIYVIRLAPESLCGIQSLGVTVEKLGNLETKDAKRVRIKWYPGVMLQKIITCAKVTGVLVAGTVTA